MSNEIKLSPDECAAKMVYEISRMVGKYFNDYTLMIAKECALICVDEFIAFQGGVRNSVVRGDELGELTAAQSLEYWNGVKTIIQSF